MLDSAAIVQRFLALPFLLLGLSHIVQPVLWRDFFTHLRDRSPGQTAVVVRTFLFEIWPAVAIVALHQVWTGPALALTLYGHALFIKCVAALLYPPIGLRSLDMARTHGTRGFRVGGAALMALGALCVALQW